MLVLLRCAAKNGPDLFNELIGLVRSSVLESTRCTDPRWVGAAQVQ